MPAILDPDSQLRQHVLAIFDQTSQGLRSRRVRSLPN